MIWICLAGLAPLLIVRADVPASPQAWPWCCGSRLAMATTQPPAIWSATPHSLWRIGVKLGLTRVALGVHCAMCVDKRPSSLQSQGCQCISGGCGGWLDLGWNRASNRDKWLSITSVTGCSCCTSIACSSQLEWLPASASRSRDDKSSFNTAYWGLWKEFLSDTKQKVWD